MITSGFKIKKPGVLKIKNPISIKINIRISIKNIYSAHERVGVLRSASSTSTRIR